MYRYDIIAMSHFMTRNLEVNTSYACLLFVDFSSVFNTLQPHLLIKRLNDLRVRPVIIHNQFIAQVHSFKYLGVFIDNSLTWSTHVDNLCCRLH